MDLKNVFELIIPFRHIGSRDNSESLTTNFQEIHLSNTPQLEGKPILEEKTSPLASVYEIRQAARRMIGLHGNEGHTYTLVKGNTEFKIGKLKVWLFKNGIGFVTVHVNTSEMSEDKVLDLVSDLCDIKTRTKLSFVQSTGKDAFETRVFTLRGVIAKLFELIGEDYCSQINEITYKKTCCLFYGTGSASTDDEVYNFLEMLRNQHKSDRPVAGYNSEVIFRHFKYITWAASEKVLAMFCDLEVAGEANKEFVSSPGGLIQSVFTNYLLLYLNLIASKLKFEELTAKYNNANPKAKNEWSEEEKNAFSIYLNSPVVGLSNEPHINVLFDELLYDKVLGLKQVHKDYSDGVLTQEMKETEKEIKKSVKQLEEQVQQIRALMDSVTDLVSQRRSAIMDSKDTSSEEIERKRTEFINSVAAEIANIAWKDATTVDYEEALLRGMFGERWDALSEYTKKSLISAKVLASNCRKISYQTLDYSGIVVSATSALENELKLRFFLGYQDYLLKTHGDPSKEKWPESMLFTTKKGKVVKNTEFSMGSLPYIFNCTGTDRDNLEAYLKTIMSDQHRDKGISYFYYKNKGGKTFIDRCEDVREKYRNKAAHTSSVSMLQAEACCVDVIGQQAASDQIGRIQGLLYDLVGITEYYVPGGSAK